MSHNNYAEGQVPEPPIEWKGSSYKFTEPIRYFKSNDPYYWKVDNIPVKQLEENILWLKDQVGGGGSVGLLSGIDRNQFNELRPFATESDFKVNIKPGRYSARINDARYHNIYEAFVTRAAEVGFLGLDEISFSVDVNLIKAMAGDITSKVVSNNGLYDTILHHMCTPYQGFLTGWSADKAEYLQNLKVGIDNLPLFKKPTIRQESTEGFFGTDGLAGFQRASDLQQLFSSFIKYWGGVARTAIVNVPETLSIDVAPFNADDFSNRTVFEPSYRIDLLFIYSHPVDASSTTILKRDGNSLAQITAPQLGMLKGAGVIGLQGRGPSFENYNTTQDGTEWMTVVSEANDWFNGRDDSRNYFEFVSNEDYQYGYHHILATVSDQTQDLIGMDGYYGNFPSPDDLLNIAPLLQVGLEKDNLALVGQSVLPVAYVIVKKDSSVITNNDIIDIRPFFRTAELAYNERAGIAAAVPPLSFANPAVGKTELADTVNKVRAEILERIPEMPDESPITPRIVGSGYIFGGLKYGVEGALLRMAIGRPGNNLNFTDANERANFLRVNGHLPFVADLRDLPDWEVAPWCLSKNNPGSKRNDRTWIARQRGNANITLGNEDTININEDPTLGFHDPIKNIGAYNEQGAGGALAFCRKKIEVNRQLVPWMRDFEVIVEYVNCVPSTSTEYYHQLSNNSDIFYPRQYAGLTVSKEGDSFTVISAHNSFFSSRTEEYPGTNHPWAENAQGYNKAILSYGTDWFRNAGPTYPNFAVCHSLLDWDQNNAYTLDGDKSPTHPVVSCTYPTVKYTIIGYPNTYAPTVDGGSEITLK